MTHKEAKALCLEVWRYLAEHPETADKPGLPEELYAKISSLAGECPLCAVFAKQPYACPCYGCPLFEDLNTCAIEGRPYARWCAAETPEERREAAEEIVQRVEVWEVEA
jgi:hypothetical protein